ncbi:DUF418 domain-containing protein [Escherichia coli]
MGVAVLILLGMIADNGQSRSWVPDASSLLYEHYWKLNGGMEAISNRTDMLSANLLALGAQYGWQLAGMMLIGAALMRSGWLKGQFSLRHYRRCAAVCIPLGILTINLPAVVAQWHLNWVTAGVRSCFRLHVKSVPRFKLSATRRWPMATGRKSAVSGWWRRWFAWAMALTNYLLQTLICTTIFYHFGLFMDFDRLTLLALLRSWLANLIISWLWLRYFRQGPVEWLWRQLTARASGHIIPQHIKITIHITTINKMDVTVSSPVTSLT